MCGLQIPTTAWVVSHQNYPLILGDDWLLQNGLIPDPVGKTLWERSLVMEAMRLYKRGKEDKAQVTAVTKETKDSSKNILDKYPELTRHTGKQSVIKAGIYHKINTGDVLPIFTRDRRRSPKERQIIEAKVREMLAAGVIQPSSSPWCSQPVVVPKPDGDHRICINDKRLNAVTIKDKFPLPRIDDLLDSLNGAQAFSTIDLKSGYWQIPMDPKDRPKTAFSASGGLYEYTVMPFGLTNAPATFQRVMQHVLQGLPFAMAYLDDVIVFSKDDKTLCQHLDEVLKRLVQYNLKVNEKKCRFFAREVKYLGFLVSGAGIRADPQKTEAIKTWPVPKSVKELQRFLGFCSLYHRFGGALQRRQLPFTRFARRVVHGFGSANINKLLRL